MYAALQDCGKLELALSCNLILYISLVVLENLPVYSSSGDQDDESSSTEYISYSETLVPITQRPTQNIPSTTAVTEAATSISTMTAAELSHFTRRIHVHVGQETPTTTTAATLKPQAAAGL
mgnify:CR=1 FL=1